MRNGHSVVLFLIILLIYTTEKGENRLHSYFNIYSNLYRIIFYQKECSKTLASNQKTEMKYN